MKNILSIILIGLLTSSCQSQSDRVENDLYNCLMNSLSENEKSELKPILQKFETHLIEKGILESSAPESYRNVYKKIAETGTYDFSNEFNFSKKISFLNKPDNKQLIECHMNIFQSEKYLSSKTRELNEKVRALGSEKTTPKIIAQTMLDYMSIEDFKLKYNRLNTLMFIEQLK